MSAGKRVANEGMGTTSSSVEDLRKRAAEKLRSRYELRLYVSDMTPRSVNAIANITDICEERLKDNYDLEVVDARHGVDLKKDSIIAIPTLIKRMPLPERVLVGDLSDKDKVLKALGLSSRGCST